MMRMKICCLTLFLTASTVALAQQETLVVRSDGAHVTVRSDESGTTVSEEKAGFVTEPISPQETAHWNRVHELTKDGGKIIAHRSGQGTQ
ncbi:MAG: hypothetical protein Q8M31_04325 [Beijerinckiaceae bacterium]|nr:hypothetical protein [Beijerinckiaceae bacterium]